MPTKTQTLQRQIENQRNYIFTYAGSDNPEEVLRVVRFILRTPEAENIVEHAKKIMARLNKQKVEFLDRKKKLNK